MQKTTFPIPKPGELEVLRGFRTHEEMGEVNAAAQHVSFNNWIFNHSTRDQVEDMIAGGTGQITIPKSYIELTHAVVEATDFDWRVLGLYVRHMGGNYHASSLDIHADQTHDLRVLVEGHGATWEFDQPGVVEEYPDGLQLRTGDAIILNNQCMPYRQLRHGVRLASQLAVRTSHLFIFKS